MCGYSVSVGAKTGGGVGARAAHYQNVFNFRTIWANSSQLILTLILENI